MRTEVRFRLAAALSLWVLALCATALASSAELSLRAERPLIAGTASTLTLTVQLPSDAAAPMLVTSSAEGQALSVVRGRLLSSDARATNHHEFIFDVPVVCRAPGTSIVRAHVRYFRCAETCVPVESETSAVIEVSAR